MASIDIHVRAPRRRAEVSQNASQAARNKLSVGTHPCHVLGLFQCSESENETYPYFICELDDGRNIYAMPEDVRFLDTEELNREEVTNAKNSD